MPEDSDRFLEIYLQDHWAGASGGLQLAKRILGSLEAPEQTEMGAIAAEIEEDREKLREIMTRLGVDPDRVKQAAAHAGELMGRLKLNGRVLSPSPLSRVVEFEGMLMGVTGKLELWRSLTQLAPQDDRLDPGELEELIERAEGQRARLEDLHAKAARAAFERAPAPAS